MYPWDNIPGCLNEDQTVLTLQCIPTLFQIAIYWGLVLAGLLALSYLIFAGLKLILSGGEAKKVEEARHTFQYVIIGFILIIGAFVIVKIIAAVTGTPCINSFGFNNCQ